MSVVYIYTHICDSNFLVEYVDVALPVVVQVVGVLANCA